MSGCVYLIRNGDLYKIGYAKDIDNEMRKLKPDELIDKLETNYPKILEASLLRRYRNKRIPDTDYFRLSDEQILDFKSQLEMSRNTPKTMKDEFKVALNLAFLIFLFSCILFIFLGRGIFLSLIFSISIASLPMWLLFFFGNLGGYDLKDLPSFSTWPNRMQGLLFAISMGCISYAFYHFFNIL